MAIAALSASIKDSLWPHGLWVDAKRRGCGDAAASAGSGAETLAKTNPPGTYHPHRHHGAGGGDNLLGDPVDDAARHRTTLTQDPITDFNANGDVVVLANLDPGFDPLAALRNVEAGAELSFGDGDTIVFLSRLVEEFDAGDFILV